MGSARIPTPLVLVLSGTMLVIGALAFLSPHLGGEAGEPEEDTPGSTRPPVDVRDGTPEAVAETFLDAWRKRDYEVAMALSVARAAASVEARRRREQAMTAEEREGAAQLWNTMAEHRLTLEIHDRQAPDADHVVLATPAYVTAELLRATAPELANELQIPYVDVANATLAFRPSDVPALPLGTGFLVPPIEREFIVGCSWLTNKWPHLVNDDVVLIKCMVGRAGDRRWLPMSDAEIVEGVRDGLARILGIDAEPQETLVQRWPRAMPQYVVGHAERLSRIDRLTPPGLHLTGAAYRGAGLAACTTGAVATATSIQGAPT